MRASVSGSAAETVAADLCRDLKPGGCLAFRGASGGCLCFTWCPPGGCLALNGASEWVSVRHLGVCASFVRQVNGALGGCPLGGCLCVGWVSVRWVSVRQVNGASGGCLRGLMPINNQPASAHAFMSTWFRPLEPKPRWPRHATTWTTPRPASRSPRPQESNGRHQSPPGGAGNGLFYTLGNPGLPC